jgi:hypothetical protein
MSRPGAASVPGAASACLAGEVFALAGADAIVSVVEQTIATAMIVVSMNRDRDKMSSAACIRGSL